jgi:hypothetical protein
LDGEVAWNAQGGGKAEARLVLIHPGKIKNALTGELRLIVMAVNGRLDFDNVLLNVIQNKSENKEENVKVHKGFYREPDVHLTTQQPVRRTVQITFPPGSRQKKVIIQLFALYQAETAEGKAVSGRAWLWLNSASAEGNKKPHE